MIPVFKFSHMSENTVERKWLEMQALHEAVRDSSEIVCVIPGWEPVDLATGLKWLQRSICEGYYAKFQVERKGPAAIVRFKRWEYGQDEPDN